MDYTQNINQQPRQPFEETKYSSNNIGDWPVHDPRPESTEIRIDPGGHTSSNFYKSNDLPFFLPEINNSGKDAKNNI